MTPRDSLGAFFWAATFIGVGFVLSEELERVAAYLTRWGAWLVVVLGAGLAAYILWKCMQRRRFLYQLRTARITPEELMKKLSAGDDVLKDLVNEATTEPASASAVEPEIRS